MCLAKRMI